MRIQACFQSGKPSACLGSVKVMRFRQRKRNLSKVPVPNLLLDSKVGVSEQYPEIINLIKSKQR